MSGDEHGHTSEARCGCLTHPWRAKTADGDPRGCYCLCTTTEETCDHFPHAAPGGPDPSPTAEDYVRATAKSVGLDPDAAVKHWREVSS